MAYDASNLSVLTYANGFTMWHYKTPDSWDDVLEPGYFDGFAHHGAAAMLRPGDLMVVNAEIHERVRSGVVFVLSVFHDSVVIGELVAPVALGTT